MCRKPIWKELKQLNTTRKKTAGSAYQECIFRKLHLLKEIKHVKTHDNNKTKIGMGIL
jgi:hypothetical protein